MGHRVSRIDSLLSRDMILSSRHSVCPRGLATHPVTKLLLLSPTFTAGPAFRRCKHKKLKKVGGPRRIQRGSCSSDAKFFNQNEKSLEELGQILRRLCSRKAKVSGSVELRLLVKRSQSLPVV